MLEFILSHYRENSTISYPLEEKSTKGVSFSILLLNGFYF